MAKCHRNDAGSVDLDAAGNYRLWTAFSGASFRKMIIDSMRCGAASLKRSECGSESKKKKKKGGSEKLLELMRRSEKVEALEELKMAVKRLQCDDVLWGAIDVRRLTKENSEARIDLALLGAISPLVVLLDSEDVDAQIASLYALLNLGIGNDKNKADIVKAGAIHKMLNLIESPNGSPNPAVAEAIVANFLGLSALDLNKPVIGSSGAIPFLVKILKDSDKTSSTQAKQDSLRALYNLSISPSNISLILETDLVPFLLSSLEDMDSSERILSIVCNVVSTPEGRKAVSIVPDVITILVDVLNWTDSLGCQEKATYILMVMAHKSYGDRQAMIEAGIASSLLELTLLGSTLAQKRASRILECLTVDKGEMTMGPTSSSLSSTVESFSGPKPPQTAVAPPSVSRRYPRTPPILPDDCRSDCDSSSSVVDDGDGDIASSSFHKPYSFDLNVRSIPDYIDLNVRPYSFDLNVPPVLDTELRL